MKQKGTPYDLYITALLVGVKLPLSILSNFLLGECF